jgi:hypothetical protein
VTSTLTLRGQLERQRDGSNLPWFKDEAHVPVRGPDEPDTTYPPGLTF